MVREALTTYLSLANGLTEVTRQRARAAAKALAAQGEARVDQVSGLAEEVLQTSRANRAALVGLIRYELERTLGGLGLVRGEDVAQLRRQVDQLDKAVRDLRAEQRAAATRPPTTPARTASRSAAKRPAKAAAKTAAKASGRTASKAAAPASAARKASRSAAKTTARGASAAGPKAATRPAKRASAASPSADASP